MNARLIALLVLPLLAGCSAVHYPDDWQKPATALQQITADEVDCERSSRDAESTPDLILGGLLDVVRLAIEAGQREGAYADCMRSRGYQRA